MKKYNLTTLGIAGMMGSGKSTALEFFKKKGFATYDLDIEAKKLLKKDTVIYKKIIKVFGERILNKNKAINKKKLRGIVFNNEEYRETLNSIVHPELGNIVSKICNKHKKRGTKIIIFEGALISKKSKIGSSLNYILYIQAPKTILAERISKRDKIDRKQIKKLLLMQKHIEKNEKNADFIIVNKTNKKEFKLQLNFLLDKLSH
ncbi:dephospho-CoA kinase [bacterium]|nr:dephospho-CoA kinase [bacterium]